MSDAWVAFRPIDAVVFRDGRPFSAGLSSFARTTFPRPTSTAGAITTVFGGQEPTEICGPLVVDLRSPQMLHFPVPADLLVNDAGSTRLSPDDQVGPIVSDLDVGTGLGQDFRLLVGEGDIVSSSVTRDDLEGYLDRKTAGILNTVEMEHRSPPVAGGIGPSLAREPRLGVARDGRSARDGYLYMAEFLRFRDEHSAFACRVTFDGDLPRARDLVPFGGEARQAEVSVFTADPAKWLPSRPKSFEDGRLLLYLATPAIFNRGWLPDADPSSEWAFSVVAACVSGPDIAASWTPGQPRPNPVRWAVAPGSVYFLRFANNETARAFARRWHGQSLPQATERLRTAGFGMCLTGRW